MPPHLKPYDVRPQGVSDVAGNAVADELADQAAIGHQVTMKVSSPYIYHYSLTRKMQRRLIQIIVNLPPGKSVQKMVKEIRHKTKVDIETLVAVSSHAAFSAMVTSNVVNANMCCLAAGLKL